MDYICHCRSVVEQFGILKELVNSTLYISYINLTSRHPIMLNLLLLAWQCILWKLLAHQVFIECIVEIIWIRIRPLMNISLPYLYILNLVTNTKYYMGIKWKVSKKFRFVSTTRQTLAFYLIGDLHKKLYAIFFSTRFL